MRLMRFFVVLAAVAAITVGAVSSGARTAPDNISLPARAAFFYPWYPETWRVGGAWPHFKPTAGWYSSSRPSVVDGHIRALGYARVQLALASWWGPGTHAEATRVPLLLARTKALGSGLRWALYYEREGTGDPSVDAIRADLAYAARYTASTAYARLGGKPLIFVYSANDTTCSVASRWDQAAGDRWYVVLKVFPGYRRCANQPDSWHQYVGAKAEDAKTGYSFSISPGFWKANERKPRLVRSISRWRRQVRDMVSSRAPWQLITSFNEWGEGTAVESAKEWTTHTGFGAYLDVLHRTPTRVPPTPPPPTVPSTATPTVNAPCTGGKAQPITHVIWIWMENHSYAQIVGNQSAPYLNRLAGQCGLATDYHGVSHPSLPNYIAAASGDTQGITDDDGPAAHPISAPSIFSQASAAGLGWKSYEEVMPVKCSLKDSGRYAVKHNPAAYFTGIRGDCASRDVPLGTTSAGALASDLRDNKLPGFSFVTPDLCNDMHDCGVGSGDAWLASWMPQILTSPGYRSGRTAVFVTWDEDDGGAGNHVASVVISPATVPGTRATAHFDHYSLLKTAEQLLGLAYIGHAADPSTLSMRTAFHLG